MRRSRQTADRDRMERTSSSRKIRSFSSKGRTARPNTSGRFRADGGREGRQGLLSQGVQTPCSASTATGSAGADGPVVPAVHVGSPSLFSRPELAQRRPRPLRLQDALPHTDKGTGSC